MKEKTETADSVLVRQALDGSPTSPRYDTLTAPGFGGSQAKTGGTGKSAPRASSIVGWFCRLPELLYTGGLVVPAVCHLAAAGCESATRSDS